MTAAAEEIDRQFAAIEASQTIGQLPIRYAMAIDGRDLDAWGPLSVPMSRSGATGSGARRSGCSPNLPCAASTARSTRSAAIASISSTDDHAIGAVYCRAEHEAGAWWIVMAICYSTSTAASTVGGCSPAGASAIAADINEHPQLVGFGSWEHVGSRTLPGGLLTWDRFWA